VAATWADGRPVAFCYPVLQTERWWDVSVDTLPDYRGRGLAGRAARAMIRHMRQHGKAPVWGALESNGASLSVARQLGFAEAGRLTVLTLG
jgi:RimJ/RimL family protein N-acetyltransferase